MKSRFIKVILNILDVIIHLKISLNKKEVYIKILSKRNIYKLQ